MITSSSINRINPLVIGITCTVLIILLGFLSGISTTNEIATWYTSLKKPNFNPPNYIFGPVWSLLYILMGVSLSIIIVKPASYSKKPALIMFVVQFILNLCWSYIFFNAHQPGWAFVEILCMWLSILTMIISFYKIDKIAAFLQIPYLIWVSFASLLNYSIYSLN